MLIRRDGRAVERVKKAWSVLVLLPPCHWIKLLCQKRRSSKLLTVWEASGTFDHAVIMLL